MVARYGVCGVPAVFIGMLQWLAGEPSGAFLPSAEKSAIQSEAIKEASGLAVSNKNPEFLWVINDSGAEPAIHLVEQNGKDRGRVTVKQSNNRDWEDLDSFTVDGMNYLLVADTGDNEAKRDFCTLYILREPALPAEGENLARSTKTEWKIDFKYEGGPRDCEAVAVDPTNKTILLLSKRTSPPELHELPLMPQKKRGLITTRKIGTSIVQAPADSIIPFRDQPTGMDIAQDNSLAAVVTYYGVFVFPRKPGETWPQAFAGKSAILSPHCLPQAESIAVAKDSRSIIVVSEGKGSRIVRYQQGAAEK
jgi:hypothetical protein